MAEFVSTTVVRSRASRCLPDTLLLSASDELDGVAENNLSCSIASCAKRATPSMVYSVDS